LPPHCGVIPLVEQAFLWRITMRYIDKFKDPRWQKKRLEILDRDNFKCQSIYCPQEDDPPPTVHVHHLMYLKDRDPWDYNNAFLITLCNECHERVHGVDLKTIILEHVVCHGVDTALKEFLRVPLIERAMDIWNSGGTKTLKKWYKDELELAKYLRKRDKERKNKSQEPW